MLPDGTWIALAIRMPGQSGLITKLDRNCGNFSTLHGSSGSTPTLRGWHANCWGGGGGPFPVEFFNFLVNRL